MNEVLTFGTIILQLTGQLFVLYMISDEIFDTDMLRIPDKWCLSADSGDLMTLDVNGDSFTYLLCHNQTGEMKVLIHREGSFLNFKRSLQYLTD